MRVDPELVLEELSGLASAAGASVVLRAVQERPTADAATLIGSGKAEQLARACDEGSITRKDAAGVILYVAERATLMALEAIQALGGNGYTNDYPTGRLLRDAKLYEIGAGTSEIRRMLIGRELIGAA